MNKLIIVLIILNCFVLSYADDIRIACVGNSITSGPGDPKTDPDTYPSQLRVLMGAGYDVQNFGVSGRTMLKNGDYPLWNEQAFTDALNFKPDIVTILLGTNDSKPWCWEYKDEFIPDYISMIDTFLTVNPNTQFYLCHPPPAFSVQWGIRDSIITTDIIPMINQIALEKELPVIDFYTPFSDKRALFPDDIHPSKEGCWEMAKIFYKNLSGKQMQEIEEVNLALHKFIATPKSSADPGFLVDGDIATLWPCSVGESFAIDLGATDSIDMVQVIFSQNSIAKYKIEVSSDNANWTLVIDQSARTDSSQTAINTIEPVETQYLRFTLTGIGGGGNQAYLAEFRVLRKAPLHAPVFSYTMDRIFDNYIRINLIMTATSPGGYMKYSYKINADDPFTAPAGYRMADADTFKVSVRPDQIRYYIAKYYQDGYEIVSDTLMLKYSPLPVYEQGSISPQRFNLYQNYPNPFNPSTMINYQLAVASEVKLSVYNLLGQKVITLVSEKKQAGQHLVEWNANGFASGIYLYKLEAGNHSLYRRMLLLK
jgi:acyl-CoA thioesterase-1